MENASAQVTKKDSGHFRHIMKVPNQKGRCSTLVITKLKNENRILYFLTKTWNSLK